MRVVSGEEGVMTKLAESVTTLCSRSWLEKVDPSAADAVGNVVSNDQVAVRRPVHLRR